MLPVWYRHYVGRVPTQSVLRRNEHCVEVPYPVAHTCNNHTVNMCICSPLFSDRSSIVGVNGIRSLVVVMSILVVAD